MGDPSAAAVEYSNGEVKIKPAATAAAEFSTTTNDPNIIENGNGANKDVAVIGAGNSEKTKKGVRTFMKNVKIDVLNKNLLPLRILFFFKYATLFVLYPFLILQLKSLGFDEAESGIINAFIPIIGIFGPPAAGLVADKLGNFQVLLSILTILNVPLSLTLLFVPKAREHVLLPDTMLFSLSCGASLNSFPNNSSPAIYNSSFILSSLDSNICTINTKSAQQQQQWDDQSNIIAQCGYVCPSSEAIKNPQLVIEPLAGKSIPIIPASSSSSSQNVIYLLPNTKSIFVPASFRNNNKGFSNYGDDRLADCKNNGTGIEESNCTNSVTLANFDKERPSPGSASLDYTKLSFVGSSDEEPDSKKSTSSELNVTHSIFLFQEDFTFDGISFTVGKDFDVTCPLDSIYEDSDTNNDVDIDFSKCSRQCLVQMNRTLFCSNKEEFKTNDVLLSFFMYTIIRVLLGVVSSTGLVMFEGAALIILKEFGGDYGLQRVSASLAAAISAPVAGLLISIFGDFRPAFYLYGILQTISALLTLKIDLEFRKPGKQILNNLKEILAKAEVIIFFFAMLISGTAWGYLESFLFWFLESLGAGKVLMGLTITIGALTGIPLLICSRPIIKRFGHVNVLAFGLFCFFLRLIGYSFIVNPWTCFLFEAMEAFTFALTIAAAATYAANLSTEQTITTVQGIWGSLYFGIGRGTGSFFGGFFQKWYGARHTFRIFSAMSLIGAILYFLVNILYLRRRKPSESKAPGIDFGNIKGNRQLRAEAEKASSVNGSNDGSNASQNGGGGLESAGSKFDGGFIGVCDINKFTDVPLDEELPPSKVSDNNNSNKTKNNKKRRFKFGDKKDKVPV